VLAGLKHDLVTTAAFTATATATDPELARLSQSWERILQRSLATLAVVGNYKDILKWWASPKNEAASQRPFELPEKKTISRYSQTFIRLLCYVMRAAPKELGEESETGVTFSDEQWAYIQDVREILQQPEAEAEAEAVAVAVDDETLDSRLIELIISLLTQETSQLPLYESPVMYYLAIRGVNPQTTRFYLSFRYTPILAHMI
jgi:hypothetical protein